jgi:hypothetical protein
MFTCYARIFGLGAFFFFLGTLVANLNMLEGLDSILDGLVVAGLFGAISSAVIGTIHIKRVNKLAGPERKGPIYAASQTSELRLPVDYDKAFNLVSHYFKEVAGLNVTGADPVAGKIAARTPMVMFRSLGNTVTAELRAAEGETAVILRSSPVLPLGIPDYGATLKLIMDAETYLRGSSMR